jgi:hypothetical protein
VRTCPARGRALLNGRLCSLSITVSWLRAVANRLTYANVVATLALFVALGGASYASLVLPAGSVGPAQLRAGAVTAAALGFPLGARAFSDTSPIVLARGECNGGESLAPGQPAPPCKPSLITGAALGHVTLTKPGELLVSGVIDVSDEATSGTSATVHLGLLIDPKSDARRTLDESAITLDGGQEEQVPLQALVTLSTGRHTIGSGETVEYHGGSTGSGEVIIRQTSLVATELPAAAR